MRSLAAIAVALSAVLVMAPTAAPQPSAKVESRVTLEAAVVRAMNRVRVADGLRPLRTSPSLRAAARGHSRAMLEKGFFAHESADGTAFSERIRRHYPSRGWRTWSVGEALLASSGQRRGSRSDRRLLAGVTPASGNNPLAELAGRRNRSALRVRRAEGIRRNRDTRRHRRLRTARRTGRRVSCSPGYAASVWIGVAPGSISVAKPRSQVTTTRPCSSICATTPRSPAHKPESSRGAVTSSTLAPTATPARILAARSLAPCVSIRGVSVSRAQSFTLSPRPVAAGLTHGSAKSRQAGGSLRTRRLRIDPSALRRVKMCRR